MGEVAYKDAVRRLHEVGLSRDEIKQQCLYPLTDEMIDNVIRDYEEKKSGHGTEYVEDIDRYGRKTLRRVNKD